MKTNFKVIAFDADDTLWVNETFFRETEDKFCKLLSNFSAPEVTMKELFATEMANLEDYGYGTKGFVLSMIETALKITNNKIQPSILE